jgi:hypothetical protein
MPTGYTSAVKDGKATFGQYVWHCARAFGALVMVRDEPHDAPIPEFEPSSHYQERAAKARAEIATLETMSDSALEVHVGELRMTTRLENVKRTETHKLERHRYEAMLAEARAWTAPSSDHVGLRDFMISQLTISISFDCGSGPYLATEPGPAGDWRTERIARLREDVARYEKNHSEEVERTTSRNGWVGKLKASVPYEKPA